MVSYVPDISSAGSNVDTDLFRDPDTVQLLPDFSKTGLNPEVIHMALSGFNKLKADNKILNSGIITIVDFSQSANNKRLYIIDLQSGKILFNTWVAHGRNTGEEYAKIFSNKPNSYQSSLGFYITGNTYSGKHGLSLKLKGMEQGINDQAESRAIVIHGADYVSEEFIRKAGRLGRSQGCPAVCPELTEPIINLIQGGTCLFIYYPEKNYLASSGLIPKS